MALTSGALSSGVRRRSMPSRIGDLIPRKLLLSVYFYVALGVGLVSSLTALSGQHGWGLPLTMLAIAALLFLFSNAGPRQRQFVQVDDSGVAVETKNGIERVAWADLRRVRILTTDEGPWREDVFFLLEGAEGKGGCAVPHEAAVRTKLLEELQTRLSGVNDGKVIEAMGCTAKNMFTIWESTVAMPPNNSLERSRER